MIDYTFGLPKKSDILDPKSLCVLAISKDETLTRDFRRLDELVKLLHECKTESRQKVMITFMGYDNTPQEIYEIKSIRRFVEKLFRKYPYILYFITNFESNSGLLLACIADIRMQVSVDRKPFTAYMGSKEKFMNRPQQSVELSLSESKCLNIISDIVEYGLSIGETELSMKKLINTMPLLGGHLK